MMGMNIDLRSHIYVKSEIFDFMILKVFFFRIWIWNFLNFCVPEIQKIRFKVLDIKKFLNSMSFNLHKTFKYLKFKIINLKYLKYEKSYLDYLKLKFSTQLLISFLLFYVFIFHFSFHDFSHIFLFISHFFLVFVF